MSKIGTIQLELSEQAYDLGFKSIEDACDNGYYIDWGSVDNVKLVKENNYDKV